MSAQQPWYENGEQLGRFYLWLIIGVWGLRFFVCVLVDRTSSLCQIDDGTGSLEVSSRIVSRLTRQSPRVTGVVI